MLREIKRGSDEPLYANKFETLLKEQPPRKNIALY